METFKARKTTNIEATLLPIVASLGGLAFILGAVLALLNPGFPLNLILIVLFIFIGLAFLASLLLGGMTYTLAENELVVSLPTFHKKSFRYSDIVSAEKVDNATAGKIVEELQWDMERARLKNHQLWYVGAGESDPIMYCTTGSFVRSMNYPPVLFGGGEGEGAPPLVLPTSIEVIAFGDFVLLNVMREGKEPAKYFLTPQDVDSFLNALKSKLGK